MATTATMPSPMPFSVLSMPSEPDEDLLHQMRAGLGDIEKTFAQSLNQIQQRQVFTTLSTCLKPISEQTRQLFVKIIREEAIKNNQPVDECLIRVESNEIDKDLVAEVLREQPREINEIHEQPVSPLKNAHRSQFAPVLSSTPVHQTSPITPIPVDLTMATPSIPIVASISSADLSVAPPSAIVPQRANVTRTAGNRPPRLPRGESAARQKKNPSPIREQQQQEENDDVGIVITEEIRVTSKRRVKNKQEIVEDTVRVIIEQHNELLPEMMKVAQATPLRGRKKKLIDDELSNMPLLEPPPAVEIDKAPKSTRASRSKKKDDDGGEVEATAGSTKRTASLRNRKKQPKAEEAAPVDKPVVVSPPKKATRSKKKQEAPSEEVLAIIKVSSTPARGKKKPSVEVAEPIVPPSPKKPLAKSKKRKGTDEPNENPTDTIQPPSPKRRGARRTNPSPPQVVITPALVELDPPTTSTRSSRRGAKKPADLPPVEKQDDVVLIKKSRTARGKKTTEPIPTASASIPSSSSMNSLIAKPPRPPVARKKKSIVMPPVSQTSPSTPPSSTTRRFQSTSPVNEHVLLLPPVAIVGRRRPPRRAAASPARADLPLDPPPSTTSRTQKRARSSATATPKRPRRLDLLVTVVSGTPGRKRNKCTCEKRRNGTCDVCAAAIEI